MCLYSRINQYNTIQYNIYTLILLSNFIQIQVHLFLFAHCWSLQQLNSFDIMHLRKVLGFQIKGHKMNELNFQFQTERFVFSHLIVFFPIYTFFFLSSHAWAAQQRKEREKERKKERKRERQNWWYICYTVKSSQSLCYRAITTVLGISMKWYSHTGEKLRRSIWEV